jgi:hypothetical protein
LDFFGYIINGTLPDKISSIGTSGIFPKELKWPKGEAVRSGFIYLPPL